MRLIYFQQSWIMGFLVLAAGLLAVVFAHPASAETSQRATTPNLDLSLPTGLAAQPQPVYPDVQSGALSRSPQPSSTPANASKPTKKASRPSSQELEAALKKDPDIETVKSDEASAVVEPTTPIVVASIDKTSQEMTVFVDGVEKYRWPVSTGMPGYATPSGTFDASSMNKIWYSKQWDNAPMPHAVFFTKKGHAIHATNETKRLGRPASHGCIRLSPKNAETFFNLVKESGLKRTDVVLTGSTPGGDYKVAHPEQRYQPYPEYRRPNYRGNGNYRRYGYNELQPRAQRKRRRVFQPNYQPPPRQYRKAPRRRSWFRSPGH